MEAIGAIERFRGCGLDGGRRETGARKLRQRLEREAVRGGMLQRPERDGELGRSGLQESREVDVERAEANAVLTELRARLLIEVLHHVGDQLALHHAEALGEAEGDAAGEAREILRLGDIDQRFQPLGDDLVTPGFEAGLDFLAVGAGQVLIGQQVDLRLQGIFRGFERGDLLVAP